MSRDLRRSQTMKDGDMGRLIENYGKKEQKEWLDNTLPDPHSWEQGKRIYIYIDI